MDIVSDIKQIDELSQDNIAFNIRLFSYKTMFR